jgi:hypothetical protein
MSEKEKEYEELVDKAIELKAKAVLKLSKQNPAINFLIGTYEQKIDPELFKRINTDKEFWAWLNKSVAE